MKKLLLAGATILSVLLRSCGGGQECYAQTPTVVVSQTVSCATSTDGSVVGVLNPLQPPIVAAVFSGTLGSGNYFVQIAWYDAAAHVTLVSPEVQVQLSGTGGLTINLPANGKPATAVGMKVYIGATSGSETLQGTTTGASTFTQNVPLITGAAEPTTNNTVCSIVANDSGWPTGTGYTMGMTTPTGSQMPNFPAQIQLLGPGSTINLGNGLPLYNGTVTYPIPILARPYNHATQSISGPLMMTNYSITQILALGVGTQTPGWPIDVENGAINASGGFIVNGGAGVTPGRCLAADSDSAHTFRVVVPCVGSIPTVFYQTMKQNGTPVTQRSSMSFSGNFVVVDGSGQTNVDLFPVGTAGTYVSPSSITFDAYGRETAVTASSAVNTTCSGTSIPWGCYRVEADGTTEEWGVSTAVGTGSDQNTVAITFPLTLSNTNNLSFVATSDGCADTCSGTTPKNPVAFSMEQGTLTSSGVTTVFTGVVPVGGGGGTLAATIHAHWHLTKAP